MLSGYYVAHDIKTLPRESNTTRGACDESNSLDAG